MSFKDIKHMIMAMLMALGVFIGIVSIAISIHRYPFIALVIAIVVTFAMVVSIIYKELKRNG